jgi:hypothetical protein
VEAILAFAAGLIALRLAGDLARRYRAQLPSARRPHLAAWAASLLAYGLASGALAWGAAAGWDGRAFRVYYLCGGLLTAPLLGVGSLLLAGRRWAAPVGLVYAGLATGIALAAPLSEHGWTGGIPAAQDHLDFVPARLTAVLGNTLGTVAVVLVAVATIRRRPLANALILAGVAVAAAGSAVAGLGEGGSAAFIAAGVVLLYAGVLEAGGSRMSLSALVPGRRRAGQARPLHGKPDT